MFWIYLSITVAILIAADLLLGRGLKLYDRTQWFDITLHVLSGAFILAVAGFWIAGAFGVASPLAKSIFAFLFAATMTALWELIEFMIDSIFNTNMQRWKDGYTRFKRGGLIDSMTDILATIVGAAIACSVLWMLL